VKLSTPRELVSFGSRAHQRVGVEGAVEQLGPAVGVVALLRQFEEPRLGWV
jgi:hypothetical protein